MMARIFLAFLASAGLFYVNIMPAIVSGLIEALGFTLQQAGNVASANMYGAAIGALLIVFLIKRLNWQMAATVFLGVLIAIDLYSVKLTDPTMLVMVRFFHGFVGGMLVGTGFSLIARTRQASGAVVAHGQCKKCTDRGFIHWWKGLGRGGTVVWFRL